MSERSWDAFAKHMRKYEKLHSSRDFRRRRGMFDGLLRWLKKLLGM